ncbi:hypothetical protein BJ170DRAFT_736504 [Xylariales sp. AK1849]|nr:hypothetical protein BJ170DRAFT_736504 [Xylariales sp. AK1849]
MQISAKNQKRLQTSKTSLLGNTPEGECATGVSINPHYDENLLPYSTSAHDSTSPVDVLKDTSSALGDATSHPTSIPLETGVTTTAVISSSEHPKEPEFDNASSPDGQAASSTCDMADSVGSPSFELSVDGGNEDDMSAEEWDAEILGEEADGYMVAWKPTLVPKENASTELIQAWNAKKARIIASKGGSKTRSRVEKKQRFPAHGQVSVGKPTSAKGKGRHSRGRGRPRKN